MTQAAASYREDVEQLGRRFEADVVMPEKDGLTMLAELRAMGVTTPVVMISGQASLEMAVRATKLGALDFVEKPLSTERLLLTLVNALKISRLETENHDFRSRFARHEVIGQSEEMRRILAQVERVAPSMSRVCILGETGTGKEVIARAIHKKSTRKAGRFITLNCAAVPLELIESELFGHEKGSFTPPTSLSSCKSASFRSLTGFAYGTTAELWLKQPQNSETKLFPFR